MDTLQITSLEQVPAGLTLLLQKITDLENKISPSQQLPEPENDRLLTRKQTAERLNITLATLHSYTLSGKIVAYRIGHRVMYFESSIINALTEIKTSRG